MLRLGKWTEVVTARFSIISANSYEYSCAPEIVFLIDRAKAVGRATHHGASTSFAVAISTTACTHCLPTSTTADVISTSTDVTRSHFCLCRDSACVGTSATNIHGSADALAVASSHPADHEYTPGRSQRLTTNAFLHRLLK
ncbi:unnamed protein product [Dibothriocephalus latus]|uniref:Uncharacterized protein n=1 Tax=Dibothriocephalus latus TaxID=60516 RepID=A0A3P7NSU3_DIBLA|nr:unnamed protein product [Dibothriocephalus latus]